MTDARPDAGLDAGLNSRPDHGRALARLSDGYLSTQLLYVAAALGIPDALADGPAATGELAVAVGELAARLSAGPTVAFGSIRQAVAYAASHPLEESLAFEAEKMALTGGTEDHLAAVNAFVTKEKPVFRGR